MAKVNTVVLLKAQGAEGQGAPWVGISLNDNDLQTAGKMQRPIHRERKNRKHSREREELLLHAEAEETWVLDMLRDSWFESQGVISEKWTRLDHLQLCRLWHRVCSMFREATNDLWWTL